jgi:hypothetical protein
LNTDLGGVFLWIRVGKKLKLLKHSYPKQRGMGFRKRFFYCEMGLRFGM